MPYSPHQINFNPRLISFLQILSLSRFQCFANIPLRIFKLSHQFIALYSFYILFSGAVLTSIFHPTWLRHSPLPLLPYLAWLKGLIGQFTLVLLRIF